MLHSEKSPAASEPLLVKNFDTLREGKADWQFVWQEDQVLFPSMDEIRRLFQESRAAWLYIFSPLEFEAVLAKPIDAKAAAYLKKVRRFGLILKSAYRFFSPEHLTPEPIHKFLHRLGDLNDQIAAGVETGDLQAEVLALEQQAKPDLLDPRAQPCDLESFRNFIGSKSDEVAQALDQPAWDTVQLHDVRKNLRLFMNLLQIPAVEALGGPPHQLFRQLLELSGELGDIHDQAVKAHLLGEAAYGQGSHAIETGLHSRILLALHNFQAALKTR